MKTKFALISSLLYAATLVTVSAASYTLQSGATATANGYANAAGVAFQNSTNVSFAGPGIVGFGIFTISDAAILNIDTNPGGFATLVSAFSGFGASSTGTFTAPGLSANRGTFQRNSVGTVTGTDFAGAFMYLFAGNGTTYANSNEFLVLKTTFTFNGADDDVPTPIVHTITPDNAAILWGTAAADIRTTGTDASVTPGFQTKVPEPSAALLGALGALGLLRRRRI